MSEDQLHKYKIITNDGIDILILKHFKKAVYTLRMRNQLKLSAEYINPVACQAIIIDNLERLYTNAKTGVTMA